MDPVQLNQLSTQIVGTPYTVQRTIGAASTPFPITLYTQVPGSYTITLNPPTGNFSTSGTLGPIASAAGQTITTPFNVGILSDPGQLDTQATIIVTFTPAVGPVQVYTQPVFFRCSNYVSVNMTALNFYEYRALADRWIRVHPGAAWGLVQAQAQPVLFQFAATIPGPLDTKGIILPPYDTLSVSTLSPALWVRGSNFWPGQPNANNGDYQKFVALVEVSK